MCFFFNLTFIEFQMSHQKIGLIFEDKVFRKRMLSKNGNNKNHLPKLVFLKEKVKKFTWFRWYLAMNRKVKPKKSYYETQILMNQRNRRQTCSMRYQRSTMEALKSSVCQGWQMSLSSALTTRMISQWTPSAHCSMKSLDYYRPLVGLCTTPSKMCLQSHRTWGRTEIS